MFALELKIVVDNKDNWNNHPTYKNAKNNEDTGLDIPMPQSITVPAKSKAFTVDLGFKAEQNQGYMLVPRSSISKTPLRLANSIGIIDKNYRGKVMVKVDNNSNNDFTMISDSCYFQIVAFSGVLPKYKLVKDISNTDRGSGGFGSTTCRASAGDVA
jgi:dUTP pyrophosphatase